MKTLLPFDGELHYFPHAIPWPDRYFEVLRREIAWQNETITMFGKRITMQRMVSWHADDGLSYRYAGSEKKGLPWTPELLEIREIAGQFSKTSFNSCLLNLYHDGKDAMGWHSDNERPLGPDPVIASVSFGQERKFSLRHKESGTRVDLVLESGSVLVMGSGVQQKWKHAVPPSAKANAARINLTFRRILPELSIR